MHTPYASFFSFSVFLGNVEILIISYPWEVLVILLVFSWYPSNCDVTFKIINKLKVNKDNIKFKGDFNYHVTVGKALKKHWKKTAFP